MEDSPAFLIPSAILEAERAMKGNQLTGLLISTFFFVIVHNDDVLDNKLDINLLNSISYYSGSFGSPRAIGKNVMVGGRYFDDQKPKQSYVDSLAGGGRAPGLMNPIASKKESTNAYGFTLWFYS